MDANDNELAYLEAIHFFVEVLDSFFGNVCELDLVFNFYKVRRNCFLLKAYVKKWGIPQELVLKRTRCECMDAAQERMLMLGLLGLRYTRRSLFGWRDRGNKQAGCVDEVGTSGQAGVGHIARTTKDQD